MFVELVHLPCGKRLRTLTYIFIYLAQRAENRNLLDAEVAQYIDARRGLTV